MIFKNIFRRFKKDKQTLKTPLNTNKKVPWRKVVKECHDKDLNFTCPIAKVIYSDEKSERAVILKKPDGLYSVVLERLFPFDDEELEYVNPSMYGYWAPYPFYGRNSIFDTEESAIFAIFSDPPLKYSKCVIWADFPFRVDADDFYWIKDDGEDDPHDLCLHGHVFVKIGEEFYEYDASVSAAALYLIRTLTENHISPTDQPMLPCCGHSMFANDEPDTVTIIGCPNGIDWSVWHEGDNIRMVTGAGNETVIPLNDYIREVNIFTDKIESYYAKCVSKNLDEKEEYERNGYIAFWNEWHRRRHAAQT